MPKFASPTPPVGRAPCCMRSAMPSVPPPTPLPLPRSGDTLGRCCRVGGGGGEGCTNTDQEHQRDELSTTHTALLHTSAPSPPPLTRAAFGVVGHLYELLGTAHAFHTTLSLPPHLSPPVRHPTRLTRARPPPSRTVFDWLVDCPPPIVAQAHQPEAHAAPQHSRLFTSRFTHAPLLSRSARRSLGVVLGIRRIKVRKPRSNFP